jgi:hypothetical protein
MAKSKIKHKRSMKLATFSTKAEAQSFATRRKLIFRFVRVVKVGPGAYAVLARIIR